MRGESALAQPSLRVRHSEVLEQRHDLVVKATHKHSFLQTFIFTPTDWHRCAKCPCPVLLVKKALANGAT